MLSGYRRICKSVICPACIVVTTAIGCGGGGNPGTCSGSAEICNKNSSVVVAVTTPKADFTPVPEERLQSITCPQIKALNDGDELRYLASAKDAYNRGRKDLDGDNDGIACNGVL